VRIAIAEVGQETDTFSPLLTTLDQFESHGLFHGDEILQRVRGVGMLGAFLDVAARQPDSIEYFPIVRGWAGAGGRIAGQTLEYFERRLVAGLQEAPPLDGIFLALHGAAAAEGEDDLEGRLLAAVRRVVGPGIPLVCPLDHHANITARMVEHSSLLLGHRTQPHDPYDTGRAAAELFFRIVHRQVRPAAGVCKIPMVTQQDQFLTSGGPMKEWFDAAREMEMQDGVLSASPFPMQPWLDVTEGGWAALVYTDDDPVRAQELADRLGDQVWEARSRFWESDRVASHDAVRQADATSEGLVILSDTGDSVYGGAPGDSTCILGSLLEADVRSLALVPLYDPEARAAAADAGVGADLRLSVGGKVDSVFSKPVEVGGRIAALSRGVQLQLGTRSFADIGPTALLEVGNIRIVLMSKRSFAVNQPILYTHLGLRIEDARMVVLKTASNFQYFERWASRVIRVDSPGTTQSDLRAFTWERLPRPIYPLDDLPLWTAGDSH